MGENLPLLTDKIVKDVTARFFGMVEVGSVEAEALAVFALILRADCRDVQVTENGMMVVDGTEYSDVGELLQREIKNKEEQVGEGGVTRILDGGRMIL